MMLGAAIDLGADPGEIQRAFAPLAVSGRFSLSVQRTQRHSIGAVDLKVIVEQDKGHHHHHHVHYPDMIAMADQLAVPDRAIERARRIIEVLAQAEARVHGCEIEKVHFHEVGAVDSIVDMLGSAVALELLDVETISCGPLPISHGFVMCDHGRMPLPAPAAAYLMEGKPITGVSRQGELVTPTGAAIVDALANHFGPPPPMTLHRIGYGAGDRDDPDYPNLLRLFLGRGS
jgi:hypothetical protein